MDLNNLRRGGDKPKDAGQSTPPFFSNILTVLIIFLVLVFAYSYVSQKEKTDTKVLFSQFSADVEKGIVKKVVVEGSDLWIEYTDGTKKE